MEAFVQGSISTLGYLEDGVYFREPDCYETIRDLIRTLRNDTRDFVARRICGERNIVQNDLIPIAKLEEDDQLFDIALRLLANLTQPVYITLHGRTPEDKVEWQTCWSIQENLIRSKIAFADVKFFGILKDKLAKFFAEEADDRDEEERMVVERIIVLLRFILLIPLSKDSSNASKAEMDAHDRVVIAFIESELPKVLLDIGSRSKEKEFHMSVLEICALVVKHYNAADVVSATVGRSEEEKIKADAELRKIIEMEKVKASATRFNAMKSRHSRFGGTFVVKGLKAVNTANDVVVSRPITDLNSISFMDERKTKKRVAKNRRPFEAASGTHTSSFHVREMLKQFTDDLLAAAFNRLMRSSKDSAFGARTLTHKNADMHYYMLMRYSLEYCRLASLSTSLVDNCLGVDAFHQVQVQLDDYLNSITVNKDEAKMYGLRAQYAISAYKELVLIHQHMLDKGSVEEKEMAEAACHHILSVEEYRELGSALLKKFQPGVLSKNFLRDLVLATHYYLRLLERSVKSGALKTVKKRTKKRNAGSRKMKAKDKDGKKSALEDVACDAFDEETLDQAWATISNDLSDMVAGYLEPTPDCIAINGLLDVLDEEHQKFAMMKIQRALREERVEDAVGLYRAARDVWLLEEIFGTKDINPEEEFMELREIFFTDLSEIATALKVAERAADEKFGPADNDMEMGAEAGNMWSDEGSGDEDEYEEETKYETKEVDFKFNDYIVKYARSDMLKWYVFLLGEFETNTVELNKALLKMLHRVSFGLNMPSRLYQMSLFIIFDKVKKRFEHMSAEEMKNSPLYELYTFGHHLLKKFFGHVRKSGEKVVTELLFWKGPKESFEIENGYGSYEKEKAKEAHDKITWSEELELELKSLHSEYRDMDERPEGIDVADFIEHNLSRPRTRMQIIRKMRELVLDTLGAKGKKGSLFDRSFPLHAFREQVEKWNNRREENPDLGTNDIVTFIQSGLEMVHGTFSRQKIIKQLAYEGVYYEKPKKPAKEKKIPLSKLSPEIKQQMEQLKREYDGIFTPNHTLVEYIRKHVDGDVTEHQVEKFVKSLEKKAERKSKKSKLNSFAKSAERDSDDENGDMSPMQSDSEGEEVDLDDVDDISLASDDHDNVPGISTLLRELQNTDYENREPRPAAVEVSDGDAEASGGEETNEESVSPAVKRKRQRLISSDDEPEAEDVENIGANGDEAIVNSGSGSEDGLSALRSRSNSPQPSRSSTNVKRSRIVLSDEEDD